MSEQEIENPKSKLYEYEFDVPHRFFPIRRSYHDGKFWNPDHDDVYISKTATKHFRDLGPVEEIDDSITVESDYEAPIDHRKKSEKKKTTITISSLTQDERDKMILDAVDEVDKLDKTKWYRGAPTASAMAEILPFSPSTEEIQKAVKG